jgi:hypothetical protein
MSVKKALQLNPMYGICAANAASLSLFNRNWEQPAAVQSETACPSKTKNHA